MFKKFHNLQEVRESAELFTHPINTFNRMTKALAHIERSGGLVVSISLTASLHSDGCPILATVTLKSTEITIQTA